MIETIIRSEQEKKVAGAYHSTAKGRLYILRGGAQVEVKGAPERRNTTPIPANSLVDQSFIFRSVEFAVHLAR